MIRIFVQQKLSVWAGGGCLHSPEDLTSELAAVLADGWTVVHMAASDRDITYLLVQVPQTGERV